jgi:hypothetical protein
MGGERKNEGRSMDLKKSCLAIKYLAEATEDLGLRCCVMRLKHRSAVMDMDHSLNSLRTVTRRSDREMDGVVPPRGTEKHISAPSKLASIPSEKLAKTHG